MSSDDLPQGINFPTEPLLKGILSIAIIELVKVKPIHVQFFMQRKIHA